MKGIVDRFEGEYVIIEIDGKTQDIPLSLVEDSVSPNDVVILKQGKWHKDEEATNKRSNQMKALMDSVWED